MDNLAETDLVKLAAAMREMHIAAAVEQDTTEALVALDSCSRLFVLKAWLPLALGADLSLFSRLRHG